VLLHVLAGAVAVRAICLDPVPIIAAWRLMAGSLSQTLLAEILRTEGTVAELIPPFEHPLGYDRWGSPTSLARLRTHTLPPVSLPLLVCIPLVTRSLLSDGLTIR
jgi:hypothetical protein